MPGPVLSEQMAVAPPMVSQAASTRTKLLSFIICFMLRSSQRHQLSRSYCSFKAKAFIKQRDSKCLDILTAAGIVRQCCSNLPLDASTIFRDSVSPICKGYGHS